MPVADLGTASHDGGPVTAGRKDPGDGGTRRRETAAAKGVLDEGLGFIGLESLVGHEVTLTP
jgi:hypothetical protein